MSRRSAAAPAPAHAVEAVRGRITHVHHASERFSAGKFLPDGAREAVGFTAPEYVRPGDLATLWGRFKDDPKWGRQLVAERVETEAPTPEGALAQYLVGLPNLPGLGPARARALADRFGEGFDAVAAEHPERLAEVPGVSPALAAAIGRAWIERRVHHKTGVWLAGFGLTPRQIEALIGRYRDGVRALLLEDPYVLARDVEGFGFKRADAIALRVGLAPDAPARIRSGLRYAAHAILSDGHTWIPYPELVQAAHTLLGLPKGDAVASALDALVLSGELVGRELRGGLYAVGPPSTYKAEIAAAARLAAVARSPHVSDDEAAAAARADTRLNPGQRAALATALCRTLGVVTGGAGTGKTFAMGAIVEALQARGLRVLLAAPTGKAAKRMQQLAGGTPAHTLHKLLGYLPSGEYRVDWIGRERGPGAAELPDYCDPETGQLVAAAILVDEASMIDVHLLHELLRAVDPAATTITLFGDHHQIPSVGPGSVLRDLVTRKPIPVVALETVVRQAGVLKENCTAVLGGQVRPSVPPEPLAPAEAQARIDRMHAAWNREGRPAAGRPRVAASDLRHTPWAVATIEDPIACADYVVQLALARAETKLGFPLEDVQILTPTHKGPLGAEALNRAIQREVQARRGAPLPADTPPGPPRPRLGDRVIQTKNNYELDVMNGAMGVVADIRTIPADGPDGKPREAWTVAFDDGEIVYPEDALGELSLAYALTVHKSQGSEWPCVVAVVHSAHAFMLTRQIFYTAVSRARTTAVLVGDAKGLSLAASKDRIESRRTWLAVARELPDGRER